jgi:hypothetical protein
MTKRYKIVVRDKRNGLFLIYTSVTTHTGTKESVSWTSNLVDAALHKGYYTYTFIGTLAKLANATPDDLEILNVTLDITANIEN